MMGPETTGAARPLPGTATPSLRRDHESTPVGRVVVPQLSDLAARVTPLQLAAVRMEVQAGERVALYQRQHPDTGRLEVKLVITGPERAWSMPPAQVGEWRRIGAVEITEDGERALPERVQ